MRKTEEIKQAIKRLESCSIIPFDEDSQKVCGLAIKALTEKQKREKGCEYCTSIVESNDSGRDFYKTLYEDVGPANINGTSCLAHDKNGWFIHFEDYDGEQMCDCKTNFCPNCGRDLREPVKK